MVRFLSVVCLLFVGATQAAFSSFDWKTAGDNSIAQSGVTGQYWLALSETHDLSYDEVVARLSTDYAGWRLPTEQEVRAFYGELLSPYVVGNDNVFAHHGINSPMYNAILNAKELMGQTENNKNLSYLMGGYVKGNGAYQQLGLYFNEDGAYSGYTGYGTTHWYNRNVAYSDSGYFAATYVNTISGTFLVADSSQIIMSGSQDLTSSDVSAPAMGLAGLAVLLMGWRRRQQE